MMELACVIVCARNCVDIRRFNRWIYVYNIYYMCLCWFRVCDSCIMLRERYNWVIMRLYIFFQNNTQELEKH